MDLGELGVAGGVLYVVVDVTGESTRDKSVGDNSSGGRGPIERTVVGTDIGQRRAVALGGGDRGVSSRCGAASWR